MALKLGILDQSIVFPEFGPREALRYTVELAQLAEQWGYERFWVAEQHGGVINSHSIASPPTVIDKSSMTIQSFYNPAARIDAMMAVSIDLWTPLIPPIRGCVTEISGYRRTIPVTTEATA